MDDNIGPIRPEDVGSKKREVFPEAVFEAFNELIAAHYVDGCATISEQEVVALMVRKGLEEKEIYERGWLNIKEAYQAAGWEITYDEPGYDETYPATFEFKKKG